ncbi:hypothetical protein C8A03DRAFT_38819 [Achaetomium macrosporum]|uniref:Extracellular membrane protein CFEM domain-containing protein n=1 Tax=Achaetomium macrosporum TaxID=79813 RepID=A0AAN7C1R3_9PEZI|nr:hypothetical protein C8A03DRAFT_38819 [Achaetomium macrosporum]
MAALFRNHGYLGGVLVLLLLMILGTTTAQGDGLVTVYEYPAFSSLRACAQICFAVTDGTARDLLGRRLGCSLSTIKSSILAVNNCYCRADLQTDAHDLLSSCVSRGCEFNENDILTAQMVYDGYCSSNGYSAGAPEPTPGAGGDGGQDDDADSNAAPGATRAAGGVAATGASWSAANAYAVRMMPVWPALLPIGLVS